MKTPKRAYLLSGALVVVALLAGGWSVARNEASGDQQTTNDAYVQADFSTIAPKVSGQVAAVLVEDNQKVAKGQLLAVIDDRGFLIAIAAAEANLRAAEAQARGLAATLGRQSSVVGQAAAAIDADEASLALARVNASRYADLAADGSASRQEQQEAASRLRVEEAAHRRDTAAHASARAQISVLRSDLETAEAAVAKARVALDAARLNLSYTRITAPMDGFVGRRTVRVGNFVDVGAPLMAVVPLDQAYVEARFRETQLSRIRPGQAVEMRFDTLPDVVMHGHVESIAPATGVSFAEVAPENATGNFTKIAQRLAVRITIDPGQEGHRRLRMGMSVTPTIRITTQGGHD